MYKTKLKKVAENLMRESIKETREKEKDFLELFDLGADESDDVKNQIKKISKKMLRESARKAISKAIEYSDEVKLEPVEENYLIELLEKYLE